MVLQRMTAEQVIEFLGLQAHPEGGFYREMYRDFAQDGGRGASTAIYFLVRAEQPSVWHRVRDAVEVWHFYGGAPLELGVAVDGNSEAEIRLLGSNLEAGERPQVIVPAGAWQMARTRGAWTLAGCTVAPAFEFSSFEMAPPEWQPG